MKRFDKYTRFNFGMYKGYELGLVFVVDPGYISWCINNIQDFTVRDLDSLIQTGTVRQSDNQWAVRMVGEPSHNIHFEIYNSYDEIVGEVDVRKEYCPISEQTIALNKSRLNQL